MLIMSDGSKLEKILVGHKDAASALGLDTCVGCIFRDSSSGCKYYDGVRRVSRNCRDADGNDYIYREVIDDTNDG